MKLWPWGTPLQTASRCSLRLKEFQTVGFKYSEGLIDVIFFTCCLSGCIFTLAEEVVFLWRMFVCEQDYSKTTEWTLMKFAGDVGKGPTWKLLEFGSIFVWKKSPHFKKACTSTLSEILKIISLPLFNGFLSNITALYVAHVSIIRVMSSGSDPDWSKKYKKTF